MSTQKLQIKWCGEKQFEATSAAGHKVKMDGPPSGGGMDAGTRPMEMVLMGLAGCSAFDVVTILNKKRIEMTALDVHVEAFRVDKIPAVFESIHLTFVIRSPNATEKALNHACSLSVDKYCSVAAMLKAGGVKIHFSVEHINT
ncbi:OsmC family protein [Catenovulum sediminis]|uniref:OsmC family protein n=1 Tax=Catenovulum sediminis TaxID=1740262 RepID=A0ABV1RDP2_9ALTE